jgi:ferric-dicitrate binding protein FerR (iron transport regulator)
MRTPEKDPRYARLAAKVLQHGAADDEAGTATTLPDRTASVAAIERALRARGRRRLVPWIGWGVAAAAAAVLLSVGWRSLRSTESTERATAGGVARGGAPADTKLSVADVDGSGAAIEAPDGVRPAIRGDRIAAGTSVRVPGAGHLLLALDTGTRLRVGASSRVRLTALGATQRFDVESGTLEADVAKVPLGGRFIVATGDAEVEVKGTRFEVAVGPTASACAPFARTQVMVQEGVVAVRFAGGEVRLPAGSVWPACPPPAPAAHGPRSRARQPHASVQAPESAPSDAPRVDPSTLAEQNDLFAAALAARRRGDLGEAIHWLDRLIARYPKGQLIDSARAERQRLLELSGERAPSE